jgi:hypothetical protein
MKKTQSQESVYLCLLLIKRGRKAEKGGSISPNRLEIISILSTSQLKRKSDLWRGESEKTLR